MHDYNTMTVEELTVLLEKHDAARTGRSDEPFVRKEALACMDALRKRLTLDQAVEHGLTPEEYAAVKEQASMPRVALAALEDAQRQVQQATAAVEASSPEERDAASQTHRDALTMLEQKQREHQEVTATAKPLQELLREARKGRALQVAQVEAARIAAAAREV